MDADEILKRDAELRAHARGDHYINAPGARLYLADIAPAERALIEAVGAWIESDLKGGWESEVVAADRLEQAYRALLAAMAEAQR